MFYLAFRSLVSKQQAFGKFAEMKSVKVMISYEYNVRLHFFFSSCNIYISWKRKTGILSCEAHFITSAQFLCCYYMFFADSKDVIMHKKIHRKKGYRGHKQDDSAKDVIPTPPPSTPTPTPSTTLETEDVDVDAQSAEDMRKETVSTETTGNISLHIFCDGRCIQD